MADHRQIEVACELELLVIEEGLAGIVETGYKIVQPDLTDTHKPRVPHTRGNLLAQHAQIVILCARREQRVNAERVSTAFNAMRKLTHAVEILALHARNHDPRDTLFQRRRRNVIAVGIEFGCIEMAMRVDPHARPPAFQRSSSS
jgi:hypothetical protein